MTTTRFDAEVRHDGRLHAFTIPSLRIPVCAACGEKVFTEKVDEQVQAALREYLQLLTPEQMRKALARINLTQKETSERLGIAEATLSRWLNETQIQSRALDNLLRIFFALPQVRTLLGGADKDPLLGISDIISQQQPDSHTCVEKAV
jgi:DNA-binding transcriptional regulator YiaG